MISVYYCGLANKDGNWIFPDGVITLEEIVAQFNENDRINLGLFCDSNFSGMW